MALLGLAVSGYLFYVTLSRGSELSPVMAIILAIFLFAMVLGLGTLVAWGLVRLWSERRSGRAGARLRSRLVGTFSLVAIVPTIFVAIFAAVTLNLGLESWFSGHVKAALYGAENVAETYMQDHAKGILKDAAEIATKLQEDPEIVDWKQHQVHLDVLFGKLGGMTNDHGLVGSFVIDNNGTVLGSAAKLKFSPKLIPKPEDYADARAGNIVIGGIASDGIVDALVQLTVFKETALKDQYLLIVRKVDPKVFAYYQRTRNVINDYKTLEHQRSSVLRNFALLYAAVALVMLLAAIWLGLGSANRIVRPISRLIGAAERISEGNLKVQVTVDKDDDELANLGHAFNRMTGQLDAQREALIAANRQIDERRRFTETVLAGVSAGVIGVDADGKITIVNRAAARLLNAAPEELEGQHYAEAVPELAALIRRALTEPVGRSSGEATVKRGTSTRQLSVQVTSEHGTHSTGFVATFDDITDLVSAQRTAAWADVARRIAHEIKNPLTPIQLSAERLKRKYLDAIGEDKAVFEQCTSTIIRQVGDIGRMVDEFSSFARMPNPVMRKECAQELLSQPLFLQREAHPEITFESHLPKDMVYFEGDGRLIGQALTNIIKNATEGIASRFDKGDDTPGKISVAIETTDSSVAFRVTDNGIGLPAEHRHRLTEPYVTTRAKGTGLGLAIVRKVMEDHGGEVLLEDAAEDGKGARVSLVLPLKQKTVREKGLIDEQTRIASRV
ncbi:sensor histidine kinase NtrY-like [Rhizomicrobium electricum]|uniref:histidine kinase n=1 Tax=Rhizomicrobium electricum TaxID=480070 RepID=A0ABP3PYP2_9PROT|nr:PAS domain-containing sensor histidine kinase [Rhizomicrobium electricum]NIJ50167.1 two-component system nitrogen regulation sensor histidine kinase NtrY [Rhizomicrobium electricum]